MVRLLLDLTTNDLGVRFLVELWIEKYILDGKLENGFERWWL